MDAQKRLDAMDAKIIALFERRMAIVKKEAGASSRQRLREQRIRRGAKAAEKTVKYACDVDTIAYTEALVSLMLGAAAQYQKALIRLERSKKKRRLPL